MIDYNAWYESLKDKFWWKKLEGDECYQLACITERAVKSNSKYYLNDPIGGSIELTELYEQCKILHILKEEHHGKTN